MIEDFEDFCLWTYVLVDDIWQQLEPLFRRPGPDPVCADSELLTLALVGECRGWDLETELLANWRAYRHLFPQLPSQSRFNRRRRNLMLAFNLIRQILVVAMDAAADRQTVIDSLPIPVLHFHLVPSSSAVAEWKAHGARFGVVTTKKQTIFGYKLHLLVTLGGIILDFVLAPANERDLPVGVELLEAQSDLTAIGDKAYISASVAERLRTERNVHLLTVPRRNQRRQLPAAAAALLNRARQIIETVNDQLTSQFHIETNHAHTFWGLCTRLYTKLAAHTLCVHLNRLCGASSPLRIKALAFPN
jgi:IS5 family transposase